MLKKVLGKFIGPEGVRAAMVVAADGTLIECVPAGKLDGDRVARSLLSAMEAIHAMATEYGSGIWSMIFVQAGDSTLTVLPINDRTFLVLLSGEGANIGRIRHQMKKHRDLIDSIL
jgi:predicted regulator of Ras-like GTPase activity (Roadblock/LC7/MglB family)